MLQFRRFAKGLLAALVAVGPVSAHEFWIDPHEFEVAVGDAITGELRNGENLKGPTYPYLDRFFSRFEIYDRAGGREVDGRNGDNPPIDEKTLRGGLHVLAYASTVNTVTYTEFEKFADFVRSKGLGWVLEAHSEKDFSTERIVETYYRYAKSLVKVGSGAGRDKAVGFPIELVAEINPYSAAAADGVRFQLLWNAAPLADWDVQFFHLAPEAAEATLTHLTTDKTGRVTVPSDPGLYLVNAVQIVDPRTEDAARKAQWESIWASTTYKIAP